MKPKSDCAHTRDVRPGWRCRLFDVSISVPRACSAAPRGWVKRQGVVESEGFDGYEEPFVGKNTTEGEVAVEECAQG